MGNIKDSLSKSLNRLGVSRQVEAAGIVEAAQKEISKYIPEEDFEVISFNRGTLKVVAKSSVAANEIHLNKELVKVSNKKIETIKITVL